MQGKTAPCFRGNNLQEKIIRTPAAGEAMLALCHILLGQAAIDTVKIAFGDDHAHRVVLFA
jgi:hypothetical protein